MTVFIKYTNYMEWDDKAKQFIFKNKLKIKVFTELIYHDVIIKNLNNLIRIIIKIDNKFYQF